MVSMEVQVHLDPRALLVDQEDQVMMVCPELLVDPDPRAMLEHPVPLELLVKMELLELLVL